MVESSRQDLDRVFRAVASEPRREILRRTALARCTVNGLAQHFDMSLAAVSKHIQVLDDAGLVHREQEGRFVWVSFNAAALDDPIRTLARLKSFWADRLDGLEDFLAKRANHGVGNDK